ncbi:hypothetical protein FKW77_009993 [Venturia effusa]|uniref:DUF1275 domain protein n=1 Tax=Venturia effusa TaxID=50376 RepID=A0A517L885_9PEZI|nr:hypothetical protein FKW77_009993 [Venturia effusa]
MENSRHGASEGEHLPLMAKKKSATRNSTLKRYLNAQIDTRRADVVLIICFFISGLTDAGAYNAWRIFLSMQTGNTIFTALGLSNLPHGTTKIQLLKSLTAILAFLFGALFFSTLHRTNTPRKRWVLILSFSIQVTLVIASAALIHSGNARDDSPKKPVRTLPDHPRVERGLSVRDGVGVESLWAKRYPWDLLPIGLLSFQAAGKVVASRVLQHTQLPTVVISVLYTDLVSDPSFFSGGLFGNTPRNRRIGGAVCYFAGAVLGGVFASSRYGFAGALWVAALVNGGIILGWFVWSENKVEETGD